MDKVSPQVRSRIMSSIRGKDTKPEMALRRSLHAMGLRFRCHGDLPGRPDIVFPGRRAAIFVHGCFWHDHGCGACRTPSSNVAFWVEKFRRNRENDRRSIRRLLSAGWRVLLVWECALKAGNDTPAAAARFVLGNRLFGEISR